MHHGLRLRVVGAQRLGYSPTAEGSGVTRVPMLAAANESMLPAVWLWHECQFPGLSSDKLKVSVKKWTDYNTGTEDGKPLSKSIRATIKWHRRVGLEATGFIAHHSGDWKSKVRSPAWSGSGEDPFPVHIQYLLAVSSQGGRAQGALWSLL